MNILHIFWDVFVAFTVTLACKYMICNRNSYKMLREAELEMEDDENSISDSHRSIKVFLILEVNKDNVFLPE